MGFFQESTLISSGTAGTIAKCGACGLKNRCQSPKLPTIGKGKKRILVVIDFPTETEDSRGIWLKGKVGQWVESALLDRGIKVLRDCWVTGSIICRPDKKNDLLKSSRYCRPNLIRTIEEKDPVHIITFGDIAAHSVLSIHYQAEIPSTQACLGWTIPAQVGNRWLTCTYSPRLTFDAKRYSTYELHLNRHLDNCLQPEKLLDRPYQIVPDYSEDVEMLFTPRDIKEALFEFMEDPLAAFDYETNMLKPDGDDARVLSASITSARRTCAFPMLPEIVRYWKKWLKSPVKKTACNIKFEDRWSAAVFQTRVRNWYWCSLQAAHIIQSAPVEFTSLKVQSFIHHGQPKYNSRTESLLEANGTRERNKAAEEIELTELLKYNGMDTILEFLTGQTQREILKYDN